MHFGRYFYVLIGTFVLTNCASVYAPQTVNVPLLTKAGEIQGSIQAGFYSVRGQAAVAVTNHVAIMANVANTDYRKSDQYTIQNFYEAAVGYYTQGGSNKHVRFEVFLGYGKGDASFHDYTSLRSSNKNDHTQRGKYTRQIFQPTIGLGVGRKQRVQLAFTPRISYVDFDELTSINYDTNPTTSTVTNPDALIFFEPTVTTKLNFLDNRLFFTAQFGACISTGGDADGSMKPVVTYFPFTLSGGLGFRIGGLLWSEQEKSNIH